MTILQFKPFDKTDLIKKLEQKFPHYIVQNKFGSLQVRTKKFTVTGNVGIIANPASGKIKLQTNYDMAFIYLFFLVPLGIYLLANKNKQKKLEAEVAQAIMEILD